jgi:hypothetical protein
MESKINTGRIYWDEEEIPEPATRPSKASQLSTWTEHPPYPTVVTVEVAINRDRPEYF